MKTLFLSCYFWRSLHFVAMRYHQYQFEQSHHVKFDVMKFELPGSKENLDRLILKWSAPEKKQFVLIQLNLDYFYVHVVSSNYNALSFGKEKAAETAITSKNSTKFRLLEPLLLDWNFCSCSLGCLIFLKISG